MLLAQLQRPSILRQWQRTYVNSTCLKLIKVVNSASGTNDAHYSSSLLSWLCYYPVFSLGSVRLLLRPMLSLSFSPSPSLSISLFFSQEFKLNTNKPKVIFPNHSTSCFEDLFVCFSSNIIRKIQSYPLVFFSKWFYALFARNLIIRIKKETVLT